MALTFEKVHAEDSKYKEDHHTEHHNIQARFERRDDTADNEPQPTRTRDQAERSQGAEDSDGAHHFHPWEGKRKHRDNDDKGIEPVP